MVRGPDYKARVVAGLNRAKSFNVCVVSTRIICFQVFMEDTHVKLWLVARNTIGVFSSAYSFILFRFICRCRIALFVLS